MIFKSSNNGYERAPRRTSPRMKPHFHINGEGRNIGEL